MSPRSRNWDRRSDEWLVSALSSEDMVDVDLALEELQHRFGEQIRSSALARLPSDWVDDVVQQIWIGFYQQIVGGKAQIQGEVGAYLGGITRNKIADAVERLTREREIENDLYPHFEGEENEEWEFGEDEDVADVFQQQEELVVARTQVAFIELVPYVDKVLSDCQRVMWSLAKMHDFREKDISRLMGKSYANSRKQVSRAKARVLKYFLTPEFEALLQTGELPKRLQFTPQREASAVVERFAEMTVPEFTEDELKPLGLKPDEFQKNYVVSIITPRWFSKKEQMEVNRPSLLFTRKEEWPDLNYYLRNLARNRDDTLYTQLECMIDFTVEDGNFILQPAALVEMIPDDGSDDHPNNTFVATHYPRMIKLVIWGFWDASMMDVEEVQQDFERWPFMRGIGDWIDFRG